MLWLDQRFNRIFSLFWGGGGGWLGEPPFCTVTLTRLQSTDPIEDSRWFDFIGPLGVAGFSSFLGGGGWGWGVGWLGRTHLLNRSKPLRKSQRTETQWPFLLSVLSQFLSFFPSSYSILFQFQYFHPISIFFLFHQLAKIRYYINFRTAVTIYNSMVVPYLDYGDIFYISCHQQTVDQIQKMQNRGLRVCVNNYERMSTIKLHAITKMPMLKDRRTSHLRNYMCRRSQDPQYLDNRDIRTRRREAPIMKVPTL